MADASETAEHDMFNEQTSPSRRRLDSVISPAPSKRRRTDTIVPHPGATDLPQLTDVNFPGNLVLIDSSATQQLSSAATLASSSILANSTTPGPSIPTTLLSIELEAHQNRLAWQSKMAEAKGTKSAYPRHVKLYEEFWEREQDNMVARNPNHIRIDAHPIVGSKVALFLQHEITRSKRNSRGEEITGTTVGKQLISQVISALQQYIHRHQHLPEYANCPDTRIPLRDQEYVRIYEKAAKANEPQRKLDAHILKSAGSSSDVYTKEDLMKMSLWLFEAFGPGPFDIHLALRDRAMLLISTSIAFRGDSSRKLLWSDICTRMQPMPMISDDARLEVLVFLADQSKTNSSGRVEEHGLFRHRDPELCGFGAVAFYAFSTFHIIEKPAPNFVPDFKDPTASQYGRRDWHAAHLFPGGKKGKAAAENKPTTPMSYKNHHDRVVTIHEKNGVQVSKITHGGRVFTAQNASQYGADHDAVKTLGHWKTGDSYSEVYNRKLPTDAMLASAMFNASRPERHSLPRGLLVPPLALLNRLFPWVEPEREAYQRRLQEHGKCAVDHALVFFLDTVVRFRTVLLQDSAVLFSRYPDWKIWGFAPFNCDEFRAFSAASSHVIQEAELAARRKLQAFDEDIAHGLRSMVESMELRHQHELEQLHNKIDYLNAGVDNSRRNMRRSRYDLQSTSVSRSVSTSSPTPEAFSRTATPRLTTPELPSTTTPPNNVGFEAMTTVQLEHATPAPLATPSVDRQQPAGSSLHVLIQPTPTNSSAWPPDLAAFTSSFVLSANILDHEKQICEIRILKAKFGDRIACHQFDWMKYPTGPIAEEWLPRYTYKANVTLPEVWEEYTNGLNGCLSTRQLDEHWCARWRRNINGLKTENARRKQIISLIEILKSRPNWNIDLTLRFLKEQYPIPSSSSPHLKTVRKFTDHLQNKADGGAFRQSILDAATNWTRH